MTDDRRALIKKAINVHSEIREKIGPDRIRLLARGIQGIQDIKDLKRQKPDS
jgi:hypothetical protein